MHYIESEQVPAQTLEKGVHVMDEKTYNGLETLLGQKAKNFCKALKGELNPQEALAAIVEAEDEWKIITQRIEKILEECARRCRESQAAIFDQMQQARSNGQKWKG